MTRDADATLYVLNDADCVSCHLRELARLDPRNPNDLAPLHRALLFLKGECVLFFSPPRRWVPRTLKLRPPTHTHTHTHTPHAVTPTTFRKARPIKVFFLKLGAGQDTAFHVSLSARNSTFLLWKIHKSGPVRWWLFLLKAWSKPDESFLCFACFQEFYLSTWASSQVLQVDEHLLCHEYLTDKLYIYQVKVDPLYFYLPQSLQANLHQLVMMTSQRHNVKACDGNQGAWKRKICNICCSVG